MNAISAIVFVAVAVILIMGAKADRKHCFCDIRWSSNQLTAGVDSANDLPVLEDVADPSYHHWLSVSCRRVLGGCPNDCLNAAHDWMGGGSFAEEPGQLACERLRRNAPPSSPVHVYATYSPSVCGSRTWQYLSPLCCWEISFANYNNIIYLHNPGCANPCPPTGC